MGTVFLANDLRQDANVPSRSFALKSRRCRASFGAPSTGRGRIPFDGVTLMLERVEPLPAAIVL
jgi:hypothetical protein